MSTVVKSQNYTVQEVVDLLGCSKSHAYKIVRKINKNLEEQGFLIIHGKVNKMAFHRAVGERAE